MRWLLCWVLLLSACATDPPALSEGSSQVLLMLGMPARHFRGDSAYAGLPAWNGSPPAQQRVAEDLAREQGLRVTGSWPMPALGVQCFTLQLPPGLVASEVVRRLSLDPRVESAQLLQQFHSLGHDDPLFALQPTAQVWHLADVHQHTRGEHVRVAVVDTGVQLDHPDLRGQVVLARNLVDEQGFPAEMHGTAVAGIIAAHADNGLGMVGVAPQAQLLALRACWPVVRGGLAATCNSLTLARALQLAMDENAQIINLSLSGPQDTLLARLLDAAMGRGIAVVAAVDPTAASGGFPADHAGVVAVSGSDDPPALRRGVLAPSRDIPSTLPGSRWDLVSGSSFAAAEVSGLLALLREAHPSSTARQLGAALQTPGAVATVDICLGLGQGVAACGVAHDSPHPSWP